VSTGPLGRGVDVAVGDGVAGGGAVPLGAVTGGFAFEQAASPALTTPSRAARRLIRSI
jgi:hypothetical protein